MIRQSSEISVDYHQLAATVVAPDTVIPGILFLHGWAGSQERDVQRATTIAKLGCVCLTFDMRGHGAYRDESSLVTRDDNLSDAIAAYDHLVGMKMVEDDSIVVVGSSYGGYLATLLTEFRAVRWLALRAPALYRDEDWDSPKAGLDRKDLQSYRSHLVTSDDNRALRQAQAFEGDVLLVESEHDLIVPHPVTASYQRSFINSQSITVRRLDGADHALSDENHRTIYNALLTRWIREMVLGAR